MPCWDSQEYNPPPHQPSHEEKQLQLKIKNLQDRNDHLARVACVAFNALEKIAKDQNVPPLDLISNSTKPCKTYNEVVEAFKWWGTHKAADDRECFNRAKQAVKEETKKVALSKLTKEERRALQELGL